MLPAEKFLGLLEQKDLVPEEVLQELRQRVAASAKPISAESLAKHLVQAGHLTARQAQRFLQQLRESLGPDAAQGAGETKAPSKGPGLPHRKPSASRSEKTPPASKRPPEAAPPEETAPADESASVLEEELGFAPLEEAKPRGFGPPTPPAGSAPSQSKPEVAASAPGVKPGAKPPAGEKVPSRSAGRPGGKPAESAPKPPPPKDSPKPAPTEPSGSASGGSPPSLASLLEEELGVLEPASAGSGDLESLLATSAVESAAPLGPLAPVATKRKFWKGWSRREGRPKARGWDSPLILVGSGALVILVLVGMVLILVLRRESGDALLEAAHADFAQGSYTQAIFKYNEFLERFPRHTGASLARVRRGVAQIRQAVEEARDWPNTLQTAQTVLEEIAGEEQFREAHAELASLLPAIAKGLAEMARKQPDQTTLQLAEQTLALVDRYVPKSLQNRVELDEIRALLAVCARLLNQEAEIEKTVSAIHRAIQNSKPQEGYFLARSLMRQYPEAGQHEKLSKALDALKEAFQNQLRRSETQRPGETEEPATPIETEVALGAPSGQALPGLQGQVVVTSFSGCVYALEAATGKLLWRRWTGPVSSGRTVEPQPLAVSPEPNSDLIVVGAERKEVWRLERATGRVRWRTQLPGPLQTAPVLGRKHVLAVSEADGRSRLEWIELDTGTSLFAVELPQKVEVAPAVDLRRDRIYLVAEHSYLWILSLQDGQCLELVSIGHEPGSITAPPLPLADWVLLAENYRIDRAMLKLIGVGEPDQSASQIVFQEDVPGHVDISPVAADRRVIVLTDRGAIRVYEIQPSGGKTPLTRVAERSPEGPTNLIRFPLLVGQQLWVAGEELTRFQVQTALGRLAFQPLAEPETGDIFLHAPLALQEAVVHVRYRPGVPGVWVAAVDRQSGKRQWQTRLAVPPAGEPIPQSDSPSRLLIVNCIGEVFGVELANKTGRHVADGVVASVEKVPPKTGGGAGEETRGRFVPLQDGALLFSFGPGTNQWFVLERKNGSWQWTSVTIPGPLANDPVPFADGLLVPTQAGRIELRDARTGTELLLPFQPPLEPGRPPVWSLPAVIPPPRQPLPESKEESAEDQPARVGPEFLVSDGARRLYRVAIQEKPKPYLKAVATADLPSPLVSPLAVVGQKAWAVEEKGQLIAIDVTTLEQKEAASLGGGCVWGPARMGELMIVTTDDGRYRVGNGSGDLVADLRTAPDPPIGLPLSWQGGFLVATRGGQILWLRASTDGWKAHPVIHLGLPLASGPVVVQNQMVVLGHDGTVYALSLPEMPHETTSPQSPEAKLSPPSQPSKPDIPAPKPNSQEPKPKPEGPQPESPSAPSATQPAQPESTQAPQPDPNRQASLQEPVR